MNFHAPPGNDVKGPPLQHENSVEKNDDVMYASDPKKLAQLKGVNDYVNIPSKLKEGQEVSFDDPEDEAENDTEGPMVNPCGKEYVDNFDKEYEEIQIKANKGGSNMMGIFNQVDQERKSIDCLDDEDDYEDYEGAYNIRFEFDQAEDSETSTITESVNNDTDTFNSADINDDDLFGDPTHEQQYVNISEKISNKAMEAKLEEHQMKLSRYQEMVGIDNDNEDDTDDGENDIDDMQERSVHVDVNMKKSVEVNGNGLIGHVKTADKVIKNDYSLPPTINHQNTEQKISDNLDETVKSHSLPSHILQGHLKIQGYVKGQGQNNVNHNTLKFLQRNSTREACESECSEYV